MIKILDIRRAIGETFVHEAVDQNISLYEIVKAEETNSLQYLWGESYALVFVVCSTLLFVIGALFCYFLILPYGLSFLLSFATETITPQISVRIRK